MPPPGKDDGSQSLVKCESLTEYRVPLELPQALSLVIPELDPSCHHPNSLEDETDSDTVVNEADDEKAPSVLELMRNSQVSALVWSNLGMCLTSELIFNVYPLFAYTPVKYGESVLPPSWYPED